MCRRWARAGGRGVAHPPSSRSSSGEAERALNDAPRGSIGKLADDLAYRGRRHRPGLLGPVRGRWIGGAIDNVRRRHERGAGPGQSRVDARCSFRSGSSLAECWSGVTVATNGARGGACVGAVLLIVATASRSGPESSRTMVVVPVAKERHVLRTEAPYAVTRHPIYTGILGVVLGSAVLLSSARGGGCSSSSSSSLS